MATEWFRRAFGAAASEIRLMREERESARLDELASKVAAKLDARNAHQAVPGHDIPGDGETILDWLYAHDPSHFVEPDERVAPAHDHGMER